MAKLELTFAMAHPNDRVMPLFTGEVQAQDIALRCIDAHGVDLFYDQLKFNHYDVSEMSFSAFLRARALGWEYVALPVFQVRAFQYTRTLVRVGAGISGPADLKGKRVGTAEYQLTSTVWTRGILQHEFGVRPEDMVWFQERSERYSHGGARNFTPPPRVSLHHAPADLGTMFRRGELDAAFAYFPGSRIDRPKADLSRDRSITTLFRDPQREAVRLYKKHRIYPMHHLTVVRESVLKRHPWVASSLMDAFERAKTLAVGRLVQDPPSALVFGEELVAEQQRVFGPNPHRYGIKANAKEIDLVQTYSVEQGLTSKKQPLEELFAEEVLLAEQRLPD